MKKRLQKMVVCMLVAGMLAGCGNAQKTGS